MSKVLLETFLERGVIGNEQTAGASSNPLARADVGLVTAFNPCPISTRAVQGLIIAQPVAWRGLNPPGRLLSGPLYPARRLGGRSLPLLLALACANNLIGSYVYPFGATIPAFAGG